MQPGANLTQSQDSGLHAILPAQAAQNAAEFSLTLTLNGSDAFMLSPLARSTKMSLKSPWPDPSFCGDYLPVRRTVSPAGFDAQWEMSFYARSLPQQWHEDQLKIGDGDLAKGAFGVRILPAVSAYRIVERAVKYGILFIVLAFTMFFLFEAVAKIRLNALNYLLVGATLCVFFLGLLALSEFIAFGAAYAISAAIATIMIGLYCARILRSVKRALAVSAMLGGVYAYLYFVLRMEDFALIAGTAALFAVLGALMYATRNLREAPAPASLTPKA
jgi:inner membrane protein